MSHARKKSSNPTSLFPVIKYKKNIIHNIVEQVNFLRKKNEYQLNFRLERQNEFQNYLLFIDNFLD